MLVLASSSPRRKELLAQIGCKFVCRPSSCEELTFCDEPNPQKLVMQNAILKAKASIDNHHKDEIIFSGGERTPRRWKNRLRRILPK